MNIVFLLHAQWEAPGVIETWAKSKGFASTVCRPFLGEKLPSVSEFDWLILMGGPQSILELEQFPYLQDEISLVQDAIAQEKHLLGFCLGAQIIGEAFGAHGEKSPSREIGVFPITLTDDGKRDPLFEGFPEEFPVVHWHSDMPGITKESNVLATSKGCPRQIIRYSDKAYGFQCHLEPTLEIMQKMILKCATDLKPGEFVQSQEEILEEDYDQINAYLKKFLDQYLANLTM